MGWGYNFGLERHTWRKRIFSTYLVCLLFFFPNSLNGVVSHNSLVLMRIECLIYGGKSWRVGALFKASSSSCLDRGLYFERMLAKLWQWLSQFLFSNQYFALGYLHHGGNNTNIEMVVLTPVGWHFNQWFDWSYCCTLEFYMLDYVNVVQMETYE